MDQFWAHVGKWDALQQLPVAWGWRAGATEATAIKGRRGPKRHCSTPFPWLLLSHPEQSCNIILGLCRMLGLSTYVSLGVKYSLKKKKIKGKCYKIPSEQKCILWINPVLLLFFFCRITNPFKLSQHKSQKVKLTVVSQLHHYDLQTLVPEQAFTVPLLNWKSSEQRADMRSF